MQITVTRPTADALAFWIQAHLMQAEQAEEEPADPTAAKLVDAVRHAYLRSDAKTRDDILYFFDKLIDQQLRPLRKDLPKIEAALYAAATPEKRAKSLQRLRKRALTALRPLSDDITFVEPKLHG